MALNLESKKAIVEEVSQVVANATSVVGANYRGLTVAEITNLRVAAREAGVYLRVIRNTLARRAVEGSDFACIQEKLVGPLILAFSQDDPGAAARVIRKYSKEYEHLEVKLLSIGGQLLGSEQLDAVADLPTYDEAVAKLLSVMKGPIDKFVRTLAEPHTKLVRTIAAVADQKKQAA